MSVNQLSIHFSGCNGKTVSEFVRCKRGMSVLYVVVRRYVQTHLYAPCILYPIGFQMPALPCRSQKFWLSVETTEKQTQADGPCPGSNKQTQAALTKYRSHAATRCPRGTLQIQIRILRQRSSPTLEQTNKQTRCPVAWPKKQTRVPRQRHHFQNGNYQKKSQIICPTKDSYK